MPSDRQPVADAPHEVAPDVVEGQWRAFHGAECTPRIRRCPVPSASDVRQDLRDHQRGGRAARRRPRRRRARLRVRARSRRQVDARDRRATSCTASRRGRHRRRVPRRDDRSGSSRSSNTLGLSGAQLHGREPLSEVRWIRRAGAVRDPGVRRRRSRARRPRQRPGRHRARRLPRSRVGQGVRLGARRGVPGGVRLLLAGGLNADNVARRDPAGAAVGRRRVEPGSRPRRAPAARTPAKLRRFIERRRGERRATSCRRRPTGVARPARRPPYDWMAERGDLTAVPMTAR